MTPEKSFIEQFLALYPQEKVSYTQEIDKEAGSRAITFTVDIAMLDERRTIMVQRKFDYATEGIDLRVRWDEETHIPMKPEIKVSDREPWIEDVITYEYPNDHGAEVFRILDDLTTAEFMNSKREGMSEPISQRVKELVIEKSYSPLELKTLFDNLDRLYES